MNPWKTLGVHKQMTQEEVKAVYIKLARKHHPDMGGNKDKFSAITGAYRLISNKEELKKFMLQMQGVGKECVMCAGKGATFKQRSLTSRVATACNNCEGSGIILKKEKKK